MGRDIPQPAPKTRGKLQTASPLSPYRAFVAQFRTETKVARGHCAGRVEHDLLDRFFAPCVEVCFFGGFALGIFLLWSGTIGGWVFVAVVLVGLGLGAEL